MRRTSIAGLCLLFAGLAACVPRTAAPPPEPTPPPAPPAPPPAPVPPPEPEGDWRDVPLSPGDWSYENGVAIFSGGGAAAFAVRCREGRISLVRLGAAAGGRALNVRTTFGERALPAMSDGNATVATLPANDGLLDEMAFSRGRFLVRAEGAAPLFLPAWPEPTRVIEDCRGA